jgi:hypothetical protein
MIYEIRLRPRAWKGGTPLIVPYGLFEGLGRDWLLTVRARTKDGPK